jgi:isopentenyldiphosphate isomerase
MQKRIWNTKLSANDPTAKEELGIERTEYDSTNKLRTFRYVQAASDTTVRRGTPLAYSDVTRTTVTSDISDACANQPAGVGHSAITAEYHG